MNRHFKKTAIAALCGVAMGLSGCGSDDTATTSTSSITTTPSLGQISNATVTIYQADGSTVLGSGEIGADGAVAINFSGYSGAVVIEVAGDADAQYFDEASGTLVSFPAPQKLRAIAPTASGSFAVSILTELAYQGAVNENLLPLDATEVNALNEKVRAALIPEIDDLLTPPALFNAGTSSGALTDGDAGKYALKLAALAKLGNGEAAPALAVMQALVADLADGDIDGLDGAGGSVNAPYGNFATEFSAAIGSMAADYGSSALQTAAAGFVAPALTIDFGSVSSGGGNNNGGGTTLSCDTTLFQQGAAISTPTTQQLADFAATYSGQEGGYDDNFNFTPSGDATLVFGADGSATYNGTAYTATSVCYETNQTYGGMLYLHLGNGHIDLFANGAWSGSSPADGAIIKGGTPANNGDGNGGGGNGSGTGLTLSTAIGGVSSLANSQAAFSSTFNPDTKVTINKAVWGDMLNSIKVVVTHYDSTDPQGNPTELLSVNLAKVGSTTLSAQLDGTQAGTCALSAALASDYIKLCSELGVNYDRAVGTVSFSNTTMKDIIGGNGTFVINGSLGFAPY